MDIYLSISTSHYRLIKPDFRGLTPLYFPTCLLFEKTVNMKCRHTVPDTESRTIKNPLSAAVKLIAAPSSGCVTSETIRNVSR